MTITINNDFEIKKAMLIKIYEHKLIKFDEFMNTLTALMDEYDITFVK